MGVGGQRHASAALPPGKIAGTQYAGGSVSPRGTLDGCGKSRPHGDFFFFVFSFTQHFIRASFFVLFVLHFAFLSLLAAHNTNIHDSGGIQNRNPSKRSAAGPPP
jgi:hypothetical protein